MRIVIVGPGAMGCLFAALLIRAGNDVWLLDRNAERANTIKEHGLKVEGVSGNYQIPINYITSEAQEIDKADIIIVFVKAYDTESAIHNALPLMDEKSVIVSLQNGLGNIETIQRLCPEVPIIAGTTAQGATLLGAGHVRHAGRGETVIGAVHNTDSRLLKEIQNIFENAAIPTGITSDVNGLLWGKLLINIGINPITAIMKIRNGEILNYLQLVAIMSKAVDEGLTVAKALNITLPYDSPVEKVKEVCSATSENCSSMLQDIEKGKKTEIEYLNGSIVRYGKERDIPTPINNFLISLVQTLAAQQHKL